MLERPMILFGHAAYRLAEEWRRREAPTGITAEIEQVQTFDETEARIGKADVLVVSKLWRNDWIAKADNLRFIQSVSAGTEQYDLERLRQRGIRLASAQGANTNAVAEHAFGLLFSLSRRLNRARDHQRNHHWRGVVSDLAIREVEMSGATIVIVGLGQIGRRIARFAKALDMRVIGIRRSGGVPDATIDAVYGPDRLGEALREADAVVLACPLTPETDRMIDAAAFAAMKPTAFLINVARGRVVDEAAMIEALRAGKIAGAGLDCFEVEPLPAASPLWDFDNVMISSHNAGDTQHYERRVVDLLVENLGRLSRGETELANQVV